MKKKIVWITADYFVDVDLPIIPQLLCYYDIRWIVVFECENRYSKKEFEYLKSKEGLVIDFQYLKHGGKNLFRLYDIWCMIKKINASKFDLAYCNIILGKPFDLPLAFALPRHKTIVAAHDGNTKSIMRPAWLIKFCSKAAYSRFDNVQMFSKSQASAFEKKFTKSKVTVISLALKDYGWPTVDKRKDCISFLMFGTLHQEKNIGLLIDAADQLYEDGFKNFKVSINGKWRESYRIESRIKHPEIYELSLNVVPNKDVPNLFEKNHYAVLPYKMMSQSGALKVAFNYCNPVVVSDLEGFTDEVVDGIDGYIFKSESLDDLKRIMRTCILGGHDLYDEIQSKMKRHIALTYSIDAITNKYKEMIDGVIH